MYPCPSVEPQTLNHLKQLEKQFRKQGGPAPTLLRIKALQAYYKGLSPTKIALCLGITLRTLKNWVKRYEAHQTVEDQPRSGRPVRLPPEHRAELKRLIVEDNQRVWTARHVYLLLVTTFGVCYSVQYLPEFLRALGLSFHKAVHCLIRRNTEKRQEWIRTKLPALYADLVKNGWRIFFQDEVGFQTEGTLAYTWSEKNEKIEIKNYGRHGRVNLIGAVELGSGVFYGVLTSFKVTATRFRRFLCHLKRQMRTDKLLVICDNASFHKAKWLQAWLAQQTGWLRLEFLPTYSPDFNPIERLWRWMKGEFFHNRCWATQAALRDYAAQKLAEFPQHRAAIWGVMHKELERLKSAFEFYDTPFPFVEAEKALGKDFSG